MTNDLISRAIVINGSPTTIFEYICQPDLALRWIPGAQSIEMLNGSPGEVGASTLSTLKLNGTTIRATDTVTAAESPRRLVSEVHSSAGKSIQEVSIEEIEPLKSKVTISYEVVEVSRWASALSKLVAVDKAAALDLALARLKAAVERPEEVQDAATNYPVTRSLPFMISFFGVLALIGVLLGRC